MGDGDAAQVAIQLAGLNIAIRVTGREIRVDVCDPQAVDTNIGAFLRLPEAPGPAPSSSPPRPTRGPGIPPPVDRATQAPPECAHLARRLQTLDGLSPTQRLWRAYDLGRSDRQAVQDLEAGRRAFTASTPPAARSRPGAYCVLHEPGTSTDSRAWWTRSQATYFAAVAPAGGDFLADGISRGFPTQAEAEAYFRGAGGDGLPHEK